MPSEISEDAPGGREAIGTGGAVALLALHAAGCAGLRREGALAAAGRHVARKGGGLDVNSRDTEVDTIHVGCRTCAACLTESMESIDSVGIVGGVRSKSVQWLLKVNDSRSVRDIQLLETEALPSSSRSAHRRRCKQPQLPAPAG